MLGLENKLAIVTGGASGIGRATVMRLASSGASVFSGDVDEKGNMETVELAADLTGEVKAAYLDIGDLNSIENFKKTVIIRPSVVCGPEDNFTNLFSKLSILPVIPVVGKNYKFQPILVSDVVSSIVKAIEIKNNEGKIYEIGGPKIISFGDMVKSILSTINKKRFVVEMPMAIAKIQSTITDLLPLPPILTRDQCEILSEADNIVSNNHLTLKDLDIDPADVEEEMKKWLWRYKDGGQFAKAQ